MMRCLLVSNACCCSGRRTVLGASLSQCAKIDDSRFELKHGARVAVSIVAFLIERDWIFVAITAVVLALLILSFFLGRVEA